MCRRSMSVFSQRQRAGLLSSPERLCGVCSSQEVISVGMSEFECIACAWSARVTSSQGGVWVAVTVVCSLLRSSRCGTMWHGSRHEFSPPVRVKKTDRCEVRRVNDDSSVVEKVGLRTTLPRIGRPGPTYGVRTPDASGVAACEHHHHVS